MNIIKSILREEEELSTGRSLKKDGTPRKERTKEITPRKEYKKSGDPVIINVTRMTLTADEFNNIGPILRKLRINRKETQNNVAKNTGLFDPAHVHKIENGIHKAPKELTLKLLQHFGVKEITIKL